MNDPMLKLRILVQAELALARIHAQRARAQASLFAVALVFALLGLGMMNLAGYHALAPRFGPAVGALLVSLANIVLAVTVIAVSRRAGPSEGEEKMAQDIRDMAYSELNTDIQAVKAELAHMSKEIRCIRLSFASLTGILSSGLVSALGSITKVLKQSGSKSR